MIHSDLRSLLIETSSGRGHVGLALGGEIQAEQELDRSQRHARDLAPSVKSLLDRVNWRPSDVRCVILSTGPGSYTSLRVGAMSAKAFAYATDSRLVAVPTFAALAHQNAHLGPRLQVVGDAQQRKLYVQEFTFTHDGLPQSHSKLHIVEFAEWISRLTAESVLAGPGLQKTKGLLPTGVQTAPETDWEVRLPSLLRLGLHRFDQGEFACPLSLEPLYLRPSSAEEQWTALGR